MSWKQELEGGRSAFLHCVQVHAIRGSLDLPVTRSFSSTVFSPATSLPGTSCAVFDLPTAGVTFFILMVADFSDSSPQTFLGKDRNLRGILNFPKLQAEKQEGRT